MVAGGDGEQRRRKPPCERVRGQVRLGPALAPTDRGRVDAEHREVADHERRGVQQARRKAGLDGGHREATPQRRGHQAVVGGHPENGDDEGDFGPRGDEFRLVEARAR
ncbi:hypothetical protein BRC84_03970 [Halobacteriales archaeon QS_1_68_44]|nr:MAG: hypothetical protein BRC84_03970 [Halobacteriales archaeon QS_1_68_44]